MKLYIGGAYQGQEELARRENPDALVLPDFHDTIREAMARGETADVPKVAIALGGKL